MYDSHIHTNYSADCQTPLVEVIEAAIDKKLKSITITDHIDYKHSQGIHFEFDPSDYSQTLKEVRRTYSKQIEIGIGVELGLKPDVIELCKNLIESESFDFVMASMHSCQGEDFYFGNFFDGKSPEEAMIIYLEEMYALIQNFENFDVLGHIDLPKRYNKAVGQMDLTVLFPYYEKIFRGLVARGKGIEVNTSGLRQNVGVQFPDGSLLKLYYDCGGRIITVGSDAHKPDDLAKDFSHVIHLLQGIGFDHICTFKERQVRYHMISSFEQSF